MQELKRYSLWYLCFGPINSRHHCIHVRDLERSVAARLRSLEINRLRRQMQTIKMTTIKMMLDVKDGEDCSSNNISNDSSNTGT